MMNRIVAFSIQNRFFVVLLAALLIAAGVNAARYLPIDAVPDITTKQVAVNTVAPALAPLEVERQITFPVEVALSGLPRLKDLRSISQFGLSQVTVVFEDDVEIYAARQLVNERLQEVREQLPAGVEAPRMGPITTGLGEIYHVIVEGDRYSLMERRTILDWMIKPRLRTVPGVIEVNSFGGLEKQAQVLVDPEKLRAHGLTLRQMQEALEANNRNAGGAYLRKRNEQELVQGIGVVQNLDDIRHIVLTAERGAPVFVRDVARVEYGGALRQGAITKDGKGETVAGITMLLLGENSRTVVNRVKERVAEIQKQVPPGIKLSGFLDRTKLVDQTLHTAGKNLLEGGVLVVLILFLFLLQLRAGLIVSSAIPMSMLVAVIGMQYFHVSANLMSLGAIDFGLIVDAAVIIVENCVRRLAEERKALGRPLTTEERLETIRDGTLEVRKASQFGEMIIIAAYIPILSLVGIEGKMFRPMGMTVILALVGALLLSLTLIPALCAYFLREGEVSPRRSPTTPPLSPPAPATGGPPVAHRWCRDPCAGTREHGEEGDDRALSRLSPLRVLGYPRAAWVISVVNRFRADKENPVVEWLQHRYLPLLRRAIQYRYATIGGALVFFVLTAALFPALGSEFLPKLDEGAICIQPGYLPSISLDTAIQRAGVVERVLLRKFPHEVESVVTRIGRPEIATDPMLLSQHDIMVPLKPHSEWREARTKNELIARMQEEIGKIPGMKMSFTQPIEMRMNELVEGMGVRAEVGIKVFGPDMAVLQQKAAQVASIVGAIPGGQDISVEQTAGLPVLQVRVRRDQIARYGINVADVQEIVETAIGGQRVGEIVDAGEARFGASGSEGVPTRSVGHRWGPGPGQRFDIVLRFDAPYRQDADAIGRIMVSGPAGERVPLARLADIESVEGPVQVSRESGERRVVVQANVRGRDLGGWVEEAKARVERQVFLPPGYHLEWGGQYEHLQTGRARLMIVVPITFFVIFLLLFTTFGSVKYAALVFTGIPFAITGGILALFLRGMHFSMSAGIGFIALFGVAVLNGVVLVTFINELRERGAAVHEAVVSGCLTRLRPVLMTAAVASIGFLPMALSTGTGAEVQKPLATVVIGGLITSTVLTLFVLPALYTLVCGRRSDEPLRGTGAGAGPDTGRDGHQDLALEPLVPGGAKS